LTWDSWTRIDCCENGFENSYIEAGGGRTVVVIGSSLRFPFLISKFDDRIDDYDAGGTYVGVTKYLWLCCGAIHQCTG
jgi:hypothetical protein